MLDAWIRYQTNLAEEIERETNVLLYLLEALGKEIVARGAEDFKREYYLDSQVVVSELGEVREVGFVGSSRDLLIALQVLADRRVFLDVRDLDSHIEQHKIREDF